MYEVKYLVFIKFLDIKVESVTTPLILLAFGFISPTYFYFFVALDI